VLYPKLGAYLRNGGVGEVETEMEEEEGEEDGGDYNPLSIE